MPNSNNIEDIYAALETLLGQQLQGVAVQSLTAEDFDAETGKIIVSPPAVLLAFRRETLNRDGAHVALLYESTQNFLAICGARNLRGTDRERIGALALLRVVCDVLAGARLSPPSNANRALVVLRGVSLAQLERDGTWYALEFDVEAPAQFSGVAAA